MLLEANGMIGIENHYVLACLVNASLQESRLGL